MELASDVLEGAQNLKNNIVSHVSNLFSGDEGTTTTTKHLWVYKKNKTANKHFHWISILFLFFSPSGGVSDLNFNPMKVVTDTVEEFSDRRDMFLSYLSNILMEDKGTYTCLGNHMIRLICI